MKKVLITGGAGFIGSNQARYFLERGFDVSILDNFSTGIMNNLEDIKDKISIFRGSIGDREIIKKALSNTDIVLHNAAFLGVENVVENPWKVFQVNNFDNHVFFEQVLNSPVKKLIFASSSESYGDPESGPLSEKTDIDYRVSAYGISKRLSEMYCQVMHQKYGIDACSFRYFNIYGPNQISTPYGFVVGIFLQNALENKPITIFGDGTQTRDFTYIDNVSEANLLAINTKTKGEVFNIGHGRETSINELAKAVMAATGKDLQIIYKPARSYDSLRRLSDANRAKEVLGWTPKTDLTTGLRLTWEWMQNNLKT